MSKFKCFWFYVYASFVAPWLFIPKKCPYLGSDKCTIWNCYYHYKDGKYDDCQRKEV